MTWWVSPCWLSRRLHSWWCPSVIPLSFRLGTILPQNPKTLISHKVLKESCNQRPPISSWHGLWLRLGRYLTPNLSPPTPPPTGNPSIRRFILYIQYIYIYIQWLLQLPRCCTTHCWGTERLCKELGSSKAKRPLQRSWRASMETISRSTKLNLMQRML